MLTFSWVWLLLLLPLPLLIKPKPQHTVSGQLRLPGVKQMSDASMQPITNSSRRHIWLLWILLITAISRPQWLGEAVELPTDGRDLMLAVDLSGSMEIDDMRLNGRSVDRFRLVQHVLGQFIERRKGDRLGLILFADHAYLQTPLTQDRRSVAQFLKEAQIGLVGKQTAIGEAIGLGVKRFDQIKDSNRILILLTDGSNNAGSIEPQQAAEIAKERGVTIYTVGVGADIIVRRTLMGNETVNPSRDLDETQLKAIAATTGGRYFRARNADELEQIYQAIDELEPVTRDQLSYRPKSELFHWPLALALLFSVLMIMRPRVAPRLTWGHKQ